MWVKHLILQDKEECGNLLKFIKTEEEISARAGEQPDQL